MSDNNKQIMVMVDNEIENGIENFRWKHRMNKSQAVRSLLKTALQINEEKSSN